MDWDKLRIFHAVADAGSFTHAGETLNLSQSAVSRQISSLEQSLEVPLFHRHARGLILTEQGEDLYRTAHDVFHQLSMAEARLTESKERPEGPLRITTTVGFGSVWLTPRIKEFMDLYPGVEVSLILVWLTTFIFRFNCLLWLGNLDTIIDSWSPAPKASACVRYPTCTLPDHQIHELLGDTGPGLPND